MNSISNINDKLNDEYFIGSYGKQSKRYTRPRIHIKRDLNLIRSNAIFKKLKNEFAECRSNVPDDMLIPLQKINYILSILGVCKSDISQEDQIGTLLLFKSDLVSLANQALFNMFVKDLDQFELLLEDIMPFTQGIDNARIFTNLWRSYGETLDNMELNPPLKKRIIGFAMYLRAIAVLIHFIIIKFNDVRNKTGKAAIAPLVADNVSAICCKSTWLLYLRFILQS